jgi:hypothetical protein
MNIDGLKEQEEQMGIFQILDRLEEAADALLSTNTGTSLSYSKFTLKLTNVGTFYEFTLYEIIFKAE